MSHRRLWSSLLLFAVMALHASVGLPTAIARQESTPLPSFQNEPIVYLRYDSIIDVREDGSFHVQEVQEVYFNGNFSTAFAEIPLDYVSDIHNIQVSDDKQSYLETDYTFPGPYSFRVDREADNVIVEWEYPETTPGDVLTFIVEYDVIGGLWVYEDGDILEWRAVPADRSGVPVQSSRVSVRFPEPVAAEALETDAFGPDYETEIAAGKATFVATTPLPDGLAFQVMVGFPHGTVAAAVQPWQRAEDAAALDYSIPTVAVTLDIDGAGNVAVREEQEVMVTDGTLFGGDRAIPLLYVDAITNVAVLEGDKRMTRVDAATSTCEYCFWVSTIPRSPRWLRVDAAEADLVIDETAGGQAVIGWLVPPLVQGERTTFTIAYTAEGAVQVRDDSQVLSWTAVAGLERPVDRASVLIDLPPDVTADDVEIAGGSLTKTAAGQLQVVHDGAVDRGDTWEIRVALPPRATSAQPPAWQQELSAAVARADALREARRQAEIARARQQLAVALVAAFILVGGLLLVWLLWYLLGRDEPVGELPHTLTAPPSGLPPGIVAYLLDEKPTPKGVMASIFQLASLGLLQIEIEDDPIRIRRNWGLEIDEGQQIETPSGITETAPPHLVALYNGIAPALADSPAESTPLPSVAARLPALLPRVYFLMGEEAVRFFDTLPEEARRRWLVRGQWIVLGGVMVSLVAAIFLLPSLGPIALTPALSTVIVGATLMLASRWMPRRSDAGAEEAARWRAFERYLRDLQAFADTEEAQRILDRHFAYAVALDVEDVVLEQAESLGNVMPIWTRPLPLETLPGRRLRPAWVSRRPFAPLSGRSEGPTETQQLRPIPSLEGMAQTLSQQLEAANEGLTAVLSKAIGDVEVTPFQLVARGARGVAKFTWDATTTSVEIIDDILDAAAASGGSSSYRGSSGGYRSSSSRSSFGGSRSRSSSRSSGSRRSGGGGRRGFG